MILKLSTTGGVLTTSRSTFPSIQFYTGIWTYSLTGMDERLTWDDQAGVQPSIPNIQIIYNFGFTGTTSNQGDIDIAQINCGIWMFMYENSIAFDGQATIEVSKVTEPFENTISDTTTIVKELISTRTFRATTGSETGDKIAYSSDPTPFSYDLMSVPTTLGGYGIFVELKDITSGIDRVDYIIDQPQVETTVRNYYYYSS